MKKKIFVDFDQTIVDTNAAIVGLYNNDFKYYKSFREIDPSEINTWDYTELNCSTSEYVNTYFNQQRFFDILEFMPGALDVLHELKDNYDLYCPSMGYSPNLKAKGMFLEKHLPFIKFIPVNFKEYSDKKHIDMGGGMLIDDSAKNLVTCNADHKICYGNEFGWNKDWDGIRIKTWHEIYDYISQTL